MEKGTHVVILGKNGRIVYGKFIKRVNSREALVEIAGSERKVRISNLRKV